MKTEKINVIIIDDHQLIIDGLSCVFEEEADINFCGGANSWEQARDLLTRQEVDVVLMDVSMPGMSGIQMTRLIKSQFPNVQVLVLTMHEDFKVIQQMITAGASGYILKRTHMNEVFEAIRTTHKKGKYLGGEVQGILMEGIVIPDIINEAEVNKKAALSAREKEVLSLMANEMTNEQISKELFISERTVETHRRNIYIKTDSRSIIGVIQYALRHNLLGE
jgi:DNA-binding NarL/FixJ family response regulator